MTTNIIEHFSKLEDPRIERKKLHDLMDIIVLVICGTISGAEGWEGIEEFGKEKLEWLQKFRPFKNGIPSHDCISYVISRLSVKGFQECFMSWSQSLAEKVEGEIISIDGKTSRGSRSKTRNPLHMVSAWACTNQLVLGQEATDEKSNEITAIPKILKLLELKGCVVTIDAMGCQREIAKQITEKGGDYVLSLKGNQGSLHEAVKDFFNIAEAKEYAGVKYNFLEEIDKGHGRVETRRYWITSHLETIPKTENWKGLTSIGMVERICWINGKETQEKRYFICSIPNNVKLFAKAVREHWGIENKLHWRLDVIFREDANTQRKFTHHYD